MAKNDTILFKIKLPQPSPSDLKGKQSVRATFKLSEKAIEAISIVAVHLGIKQKSLFDHLMEDIQTLDLIAREIQTNDYPTPNRIQKTFVLSRRTLLILEEVAKNNNAPRDALVEYSIQRLLPIIIKERDKHRKRKEMLAEMTDFLDQGCKLVKKAQEHLGMDDALTTQLESVLSVCENAHHNIHSYIERGKIIEDFSLDFGE